MISSIMLKEAQSAPSVVANQLIENIEPIKALIAHLHKNPPPYIMSIARGSSDHAAHFAKYLFSLYGGLVTSSIPPSVSSLYHSKLHCKNALAIAVSQSGASHDICSSLQTAKEGGATTVAIVNQVNSPLADIADFIIPIHAGEEKAVAATKTYIASLTALTQLCAYYTKERNLLNNLAKLPETLEQALTCSWSNAVEKLKDDANLIVLGRGLSFPVSQEAALKFKETANMHAESFSAAEFQHGPMALAQPNFSLFCFAQNDATLPSTLALMKKMQQFNTNSILAASNNIDTDGCANLVLPLPNSLHPACDPIVSIQAFYPMMAELTLARGFNPDTHENLNKVTSTQ